MNLKLFTIQSRRLVAEAAPGAETVRGAAVEMVQRLWPRGFARLL